MRIEFLGHAGFLVDCGNGDRILCDPWFSPHGAYAAAWFPMPLNSNIHPELLEEATHLYISHWHQDHLDEWFLKGRSDEWKKNVIVVIPKFRYPKLRRIVEECGYSKIVEIDGELMTKAGTRLYLQTDDNPLYSDSSLTMEAGGEVFVNANDCKLSIGQEEEIVRRFGKVDYFAAQFSGATFHPTCYDYSDTQKIEISEYRRAAKFKRIVSSIERLGASVYIPSAGPACFLSDDLLRLNLSETTVFSSATEFRLWLDSNSPKREWAFTELAPGDSIAELANDRILDRVLVPTSRAEIEKWRSEKQPLISEEIDRYRTGFTSGETDTTLVELTKAHFQSLLEQVPELAVRANVTLKVTIEAEAEHYIFYVNTFRGEIYDTERKVFNQRYELSLDRFWMAALVAKKINWEDLILSFRFRIHRDPDTYNEAFIAFLQLETSEERSDYILHLDRLSSQNRERITREYCGEVLEYDRYCPHNCEDLSEVTIENGVLTCPRHFWRFSLIDGSGLNNEGSIHLIHCG